MSTFLLINSVTTAEPMCPQNISCVSSSAVPSSTEPGSAGSFTSADIGTSYLILLCSLNSIFSFIGSIGNALVLGAIIQNEYLRSFSDILICSLSSSDFVVTAIYQPVNAYRYANFDEASTVTLAVMSFLGHMSLIASVSNIFCITVERLIAVRSPLKHAQYVTYKRVFFAIAVVWVISVTAGVVYVESGTSRIFLQAYFSLLLFGTVVMYVYILIVARKQENAVMDLQVNETNHVRERKAARTVAIVLGVALACWLPLIMVPAMVSPTGNPLKFRKVFYLLQTVSIFNSAINPYVYCIRSRRYRRAFSKLLHLPQRSGVTAFTLDQNSRTVPGGA